MGPDYKRWNAPTDKNAEAVPGIYLFRKLGLTIRRSPLVKTPIDFSKV